MQKIRILHLTEDNAWSAGGVASVVRDAESAARNSSSLESRTFWPGEVGRFGYWRDRVVHKLNRLLVATESDGAFRCPSLTNIYPPSDLVNWADVLHLHKPAFLEYAARAKERLPRLKVVFHAHSILGLSGGCVLQSECAQLRQGCSHCPLLRPLFRPIARRGMAARVDQFTRIDGIVVANSQYTKSVVERSPVAAVVSNTIVIPPCVDTHEFYPEPAAFESSHGNYRMGFVAASLGDQNKQFEHFAEVVRALASDLPVRGFAAGYSSETLRERHPYITFCGTLAGASLREFYSTLDVLLVCSRSESFGKVAIEAQYCRVPVVAYRVGGLPETMVEGKSGVMVPLNDLSELTKSTRRILEHGHNWLRFEDQDVRKSLAKYSSDNVEKQYERLYHELVSNAV